MVGRNIHTIFAIDPGGTTGWCALEFDISTLSDPRSSVVDAICRWRTDEVSSVGPWPRGEIRSGDGGEVFAAKMVVSIVERFRPEVLIIEDFILRASTRDRSLLSPVRITAMIEYGIRMSEVGGIAALGAPGRLVFQSARDKEVTTNDRLRRWGLWVPGKDARAAMKHALLYLRRIEPKLDY